MNHSLWWLVSLPLEVFKFVYIWLEGCGPHRVELFFWVFHGEGARYKLFIPYNLKESVIITVWKFSIGKLKCGASFKLQSTNWYWFNFRSWIWNRPTDPKIVLGHKRLEGRFQMDSFQSPLGRTYILGMILHFLRIGSYLTKSDIFQTQSLYHHEVSHLHFSEGRNLVLLVNREIYR